MMNLPDKNKVLSALAEVWRIHLEAETGRKVEVKWTIDARAPDVSTSGTAWSGTGQDAGSIRR